MSTEQAIAQSPSLALPHQASAAKPRKPQAAVWKSNRVRIGAGGLAALAIVALLADVIAPADPLKMDYVQTFRGPGEDGFILGSDEFGRDILSRLIFGARVSLQVAVLSVVLSTVAGVFLGLVAGYFGGLLDAVIMRLMDVLLCFPPILMAISILTFMGNSQLNLIIAIAVLFTPGFVRIIYSSVVMLKHEEFVIAAQSMGATSMRILFTAMLPNVMSPVLVRVSLALGSAILLESGLSFLGLGTTPPTPSWGVMLSGGRAFITHDFWLVVWPSLTVASAILCTNILGDGLRDALDPRLRR